MQTGIFVRGRSKETLLLERLIETVVEERKPITVRGVCYALFVADYIDSMSAKSTQKISRIMTRMREEGKIDWRDVVDDSRTPTRVSQWSNPNEIISAAVNTYRKDYWQDQECVVEVWSEKATVRGLLQPVLDEWGVVFRPFKGFGSFTSVKQAAADSAAANWEGKETQVIYLGDHDPSGRYMSDVDLPGRLTRYGASLKLRRIAVDMDDDRHLPSFTAKGTDKRYKWFTQKYGTRCIELDAIDPNELRKRVSEQIESRVDLLKWERMLVVEQAEQDSMRDFLTQWGAANG